MLYFYVEQYYTQDLQHLLQPTVRIYYIYNVIRSNAADGQRTADG